MCTQNGAYNLGVWGLLTPQGKILDLKEKSRGGETSEPQCHSLRGDLLKPGLFKMTNVWIAVTKKEIGGKKTLLVPAGANAPSLPRLRPVIL